MMLTLLQFLRQPAIERMGWTLLHFLWQGSAIAAVFGVGLLALRRRSANAKYLAGCLAMLLMMLTPIATFFLTEKTKSHVAASSNITLNTIMAASIDPQPTPAMTAVPLPATPSDNRVVTVRASRAIIQALTLRLDPFLPGFVFCWLMGVLLLSIRLLGGWARTQTIKHSGEPLSDASWTQRLDGIIRRMELSRPVRLLKSALIEAPLVIGWLRPAILLPASALSGLSPQQLEAILAHELAHIRRHDYLVNLLQTLVETILFYHPAVWWISRCIRQERENCCDDAAIAVCGDRIAYARTLTTLEELRGESSQLAMAARGGSLLSRIRRLVGLPERDVSGSTWWPAAMLLASILAVAVVSVSMGNDKSEPSQSAIETNMVVVRVIDTAGRPIFIKQIEQALVEDDYTREAAWAIWADEMPIERRLAGESILVKWNPIFQRRSGLKIRLFFQTGQGLPAKAEGIFPESASQPIVLKDESVPDTSAIDQSSGLSDVQPDEIAGRVVDPQGNPVASAAVSLGCRSCPTVATDKNGVFRFPNRAKSWFSYLLVEQPGFATRCIMDIPIGRGFTVKLDNSTRLKGQFTLPDGKPAGRVAITLLHDKLTTRSELGYITHAPRLERQTDAHGEYDFPVEPGVYEMQALKDDGFFVRQTGLKVIAGTITTLPSQLEPGVRLRLQVIDNLTGQPVAGANLWIWYESRPYNLMVKKGSERVTDEHGFVEWDNLMPGRTTFELSKKGYRRFWSTNDVEGQRRTPGIFGKPPQGGEAFGPLKLDLKRGMSTVIVQTERALRVFGKVVGPDGQSIAKAELDVNVPAYGTLHGDARFRMITDDAGQFNSYLPPGNGTIYDLSAHDPQGRWANAVSKTFDSKPGDELEFTLQMLEGGWITGRVIDHEGKPVSNVEVFSVANDRLDNDYFDPAAITDDQGRFRLGPMREGDYGIGQRKPKTVSRAGLNKSSEKRLLVSNGRITDVGEVLPTSNSQE